MQRRFFEQKVNPVAQPVPKYRFRAAAHRIPALLCGIFLCCAVLPVHFAYGQQGRIDPRQTEKTFEEFRRNKERSKSEIVLPQAGQVRGKGDTRPLFVLRSISLEGARSIPSAELAEAAAPYLGKKVSQADLGTIAEAMGEQYRAAGYHLSRAIVPPQDIRNGRVRFRIIEGSITDIVVEGYGSARYGVRAILEPILNEHPSRLMTLERYLLLVNERPGTRIVDSALAEIGNGSGRFKLTVQVENWRMYSATGIANWSPPSVGPLQAYSSTAFNSYILPGDTLGINLSTIPDTPNELRFGQLFYDAPIGFEGARLGGSASYGEIQPGDARKKANTHQYVEGFELHTSVVPLLTRATQFRVIASLGVANNIERDSSGTNYDDRVRTVALIADYQARNNNGGWIDITAGVRQGLNILGASQRGDVLVSTPGASPDFTKFEGAFTGYQKFSGPWSLKLSAAAQFASGPLLLTQQFYIGGAVFGRGYDSGEISADNGIAGAAEIRFDQPLSNKWITSYQLYAFLDGGAVWNSGGSLSSSTSLSSAGGGIRLYFADNLQADVGVGFPLDYRSATNLDRDPRFFFSITKSFKLCVESISQRCL
jgi:hemolysin activation/secretion protein